MFHFSRIQAELFAIFANRYYIYCLKHGLKEITANMLGFVSGANGYPESNMHSNVLSNVPWQVMPAGASPLKVVSVDITFIKVFEMPMWGKH